MPNVVVVPQVQDVSGNPVVGSLVTVCETDTGSVVGEGTTDQNGMVTIVVNVEDLSMALYLWVNGDEDYIPGLENVKAISI
jgi:hypothetical protein